MSRFRFVEDHHRLRRHAAVPDPAGLPVGVLPLEGGCPGPRGAGRGRGPAGRADHHDSRGIGWRLRGAEGACRVAGGGEPVNRKRVTRIMRQRGSWAGTCANVARPARMAKVASTATNT